MENKTYAQRILNDYTEKELTKTDELKSLDKKVRKTPQIFAIIFRTVYIGGYHQFHQRTLPSPLMRYFSVVRAKSPIGPLT